MVWFFWGVFFFLEGNGILEGRTHSATSRHARLSTIFFDMSSAPRDVCFWLPFSFDRVPCIIFLGKNIDPSLSCLKAATNMSRMLLLWHKILIAIRCK